MLCLPSASSLGANIAEMQELGAPVCSCPVSSAPCVSNININGRFSENSSDFYKENSHVMATNTIEGGVLAMPHKEGVNTGRE